MKKMRYFNYKKKRHIIYDYLKKGKMVTILEDISKNNNN